MYKCKHCPMEYSSKKALVNHLSSKQHKKQSVFCPWCPVKNIITRVVDLKAHCMSKHYVELDLQPKNFMGGNNCFYFAVYPEDYVDIFKPEPWANQMAVEARRLMMNMCEKIGMSLQERDQIREGWRQGKKKLECREEKDSEMKKRRALEKPVDVSKLYNQMFTASPLNLAESESGKKHKGDKQSLQPQKKVKLNTENKKDETSDKQEKHKDTKGCEQNKEQRDNTQDSRHNGHGTNHHSDKHKEHKTPTHSDKDKERRDIKQGDKHKDNGSNRQSDEQTVANEMKEADTDVEDELEESSEQTVIKLETGKDGIRRLITLKQKVKGSESASKRNDTISGKLNGNEDEIMKGVDEDEKMTEGDDNMVMNDKGKDCVERMCTEMGIDTEGNSKGLEVDMRSNMKMSERGDATDPNTELGIDDEVGEETSETDMEETENGEVSDGECGEVDMNEMDMASVWKKWNMEGPRNKAEKESKSAERTVKLKHKNGQWRRIIEIPKKQETEEAVKNLMEKELGKKDVAEVEKDARELAQTHPQTNPQTHPQTKPQTFAERSVDILKKGAMPLCPPGRRDWSSVVVPMIIPVGETSFSWPPLGWQSMSSDRKLLEWETTSWRLEMLIYGYLPSHLSRRYLLDRYMFLALPGSDAPKVEATEKACSASRAYMYKMLKELAKGERQPTKAEEDQIITLEYLTSSEISSAIDLKSLNVPLRLAEDNTK